MKAFKRQVMTMIQSSDASIRGFYAQKLANDLNIPIESLEIIQRVPFREPVIPKIEKPKMLDRHAKAERYLIFAMLRSKKSCGSRD